MKNIFILIAVLFITACDFSKNQNPFNLPKYEQTLTHKAYHYIDINEQEDRTLIKDIMGVDPVLTEWCAAFVNMILLENNIPTSESVSDYPLLARSFLDWGFEVKEPAKGDIVVFKRGESWQGHVGFYVSTSKDQNGKEYYNILGGNQDDSVNISQYPASRVLSIRRYE